MPRTDYNGYSPGSPFYRDPGTSGYNVAPAPMSGQGPYGRVPGVIGMPNPAEDLGAQYPNLTGTNEAASNALIAKLRGQVSPQTVAALQTNAAQFGVGAGMAPGLNPGSLAWHNLMGNIAGYSERQQNEGIQGYSSLIPTISRTQTVTPELQSEIASHNALNRAAPDPTQANSVAQGLFSNYLNSMRGGGGASGTRGTGADFVRQPWAGDALNPGSFGGEGRLGPGPGYANASNFGGYGGSSFGGYGGSQFSNGNLADMAFLRDMGENPGDWGYGPGGGYSYIAQPNTPYAGTQDYSNAIGPSPQNYNFDYSSGPFAGLTNEEIDNLLP